MTQEWWSICKAVGLVWVGSCVGRLLFLPLRGSCDSHWQAGEFPRNLPLWSYRNLQITIIFRDRGFNTVLPPSPSLSLSAFLHREVSTLSSPICAVVCDSAGPPPGLFPIHLPCFPTVHGFKEVSFFGACHDLVRVCECVYTNL